VITEEQASKLRHGDILHAGECRMHVGKRGAVSYFIEKWRVNGAFRQSKPGEHWHIPVKYGLKYFMHLTSANAHLFHLSAECPILNIEKKGV
jgi:hypothetical protein